MRWAHALWRTEGKSKMKVVITDYEYDHVDLERAIVEGAGFEFQALHCKSEEDLIGSCSDADALIVQYSVITRKVIESLKQCKVIVRYGIGVDNVDLTAASDHGIPVCNVPDYGIEEVSNHAIAMIMALSRRLTLFHSEISAGRWGYGCAIPLRRMSECTLGLYGLGRIPSAVAAKMKAFGMRIIACDPFASAERAAELGVELVSFDTLISESDYLSLHVPLTPETEGCFNADVFRRMKNSAVLVNTSRGPVIKEADLVEALKNGEIAGAGLDVYEHEPIDAENPLLTLPNVICTPHAAWYTEDAIAAVQSKAAEEAVNVLGGNRPWHQVNK